MADPHTTATFAFAALQREPEFRKAFSWLHNTIVCIESDTMAEVVNDRMTRLFPDGGSIACYFPDRRRMYFAQAVPRSSPRRREPLSGDDILNLQEATTTVGAVFDWLASQNGIDSVEFGEVSTVEVEKKLALT